MITVKPHPSGRRFERNQRANGREDVFWEGIWEWKAAMLEINPAKVRQVIQEARVFDAKEGISDPDPASNGTDDGMVDVLEDFKDDASYTELMEYIRSLDEEEQINLVALAWVGRGTYDVSQWQEALEEARRAHNGRTAEYLTSLPKLGDYLEEGLSLVEEAEEFDSEGQDEQA